MFGESLGILTVICAIKEPRVMRHMNAEAALSLRLRWSRGWRCMVAAIATTLFCSFMWLWEMEVFEDGG